MSGEQEDPTLRRRNSIRRQLIELAAALRRRDQLITAGKDAGLSVSEMARITGLNRQHLYVIIDRYRKRNPTRVQKEAQKEAQKGHDPCT